MKKLIADSKAGDSTKEEIPVISSISSGKEKSDAPLGMRTLQLSKRSGKRQVQEGLKNVYGRRYGEEESR